MHMDLATRYFNKKGSAPLILEHIDQAIQQAAAKAANLRANFALVEDLLAAGERRRLGRVQGIPVQIIDYDGNVVQARVQGQTGDYNTRITLKPRRGHHCICPDWAKNGRAVGPCKHVMALGLVWKDQVLVPEANNLFNALSAAVY